MLTVRVNFENAGIFCHLGSVHQGRSCVNCLRLLNRIIPWFLAAGRKPVLNLDLGVSQFKVREVYIASYVQHCCFITWRQVSHTVRKKTKSKHVPCKCKATFVPMGTEVAVLKTV